MESYLFVVNALRSENFCSGVIEIALGIMQLLFITETCPCKSDHLKFAPKRKEKWGKPCVGIDKHKISLCLKISGNCWTVFYFYADSTFFYTKLIICTYI